MKLSLSAILATLALSLSVGCGGSAAPPEPAPAAEEDDAPFGDEVRAKTDKSIQDEVAAAAEGAIYVSEGDYPFKLVKGSLPDGTRTITEALVREKLAWVIDHDPDADKPLATLHAQSETFSAWKKSYASCEADAYPGPEECAKIQKMNAALERNLRGLKVFYFGRAGSPGHVDGVAVSVVIVGRTPKGNLVGVRTLAIWT